MARRNRIPRDGAPAPPPRDETPPEPHQVVSAGEGGGFGVTSRDGGLEPKWFDSRKAAEDFAKAQRVFFEGLARAAAQAGATAGTVAAQVAGHAAPPIPMVGGRGTGPIPTPATPTAALGGFGPAPIPAPSPPIPAPAFAPGPMFPPGMYGAAGVAAPAGPVSPPSPWPASMTGATAPGPAMPPPPVAPAGAWPVGMGPAATPHWPAGMTPGATSFGPPLPPGAGGFPASMTGGYQPPPPAAPTPPSLKDIFRDLGKDLVGAIKDGHPGRSDWVKIGEALGKGVDKAGPIATAAGIPLPEAVKLGMSATKLLTARLDDVSRLVGSGYAAGQEAAAINAGNRHLAAYDGAIAGAFGQLNFGDFRRTFEMARATSGTAATLARSVDRMKDAWQPYEVFKADVGNRWGAFQAARGEAIGDLASIPFDAFNSVLQYVDPDAKSSTWAGKGAAYLQVGAIGAIIGGLAAGPIGAAGGGLIGAGLTAGADWWKGPAKPAPDPWGDFLKDVSNAKPHRPAREVKAF